MTYNLNLEIPGWVPADQLQVLAEYASQVPENGIIVEVGTYFGRSAYALAANCHPSVKVFCVDFFYYEDVMVTAGYAHQGRNRQLWDFCFNSADKDGKLDLFRWFLHFMRDLPNVVPIRERSPLGGKFEFPIDLIFIDGSHEYEDVKKDLTYWCDHMNVNGVILGHDYQPGPWDGVVRAVTEFITENPEWTLFPPPSWHTIYKLTKKC